MPISDFFGMNKKKSTVRVIVPPSSPDPPTGAVRVPAEELPAVPAGMWEKCGRCHKIIYADDLESNLKVCPHCNNHFRLTAKQRVEITADEGSFEEFDADYRGGDPLAFPGYGDKLRTARAFTGLHDAIITGTARIQGLPCVICAMDSAFMMGSMGVAVGEKMARAAEKAIKTSLPLVVFTVSGGARMQEGIVSLMQMAKVSATIGRLNEAGLLYIVVLTDPTTGGVTASFAMLGDITLAEPNALVGFAGRRVIEQTIKQVLPESFQRAEFLQDRGFVDCVVDRRDMNDTLGRLLKMHERSAKGEGRS